MIPILFEPTEKDFTSNGIGKLSDVSSCLVTEKRNGEFELVLKYPINGMHYNDITIGRVIAATHDEEGDLQPFEIYKKSAPLNGVITFFAHHISYNLTNVILKPTSAGSVVSALQKLTTDTMTEQPFEFWTDKATVAQFKTEVPMSVRSVLGGTEGSILDVYGGEYEFDKYLVKLYNERGSDNGVTVRYAKNLTKLTQINDALNIYNTVVPYWSNGQGVVVYGTPVSAQGGIMHEFDWTDYNDEQFTDENGNVFRFDYYQAHTTTMDLSQEFDDVPTVEQLESKAASLMKSNSPWNIAENITFNFAALWQTEEYKDIAPLERVKLCDTVTVIYTALGVHAKGKVVKVVWNTLLDRYESIEIGNARSSFADEIKASTAKAMKAYPTTTAMNNAIEHATKLITGGMGGHVVFNYDADGKPTEIYIMDTEDVETAVHVLRINVNGIGFSSNGINGEYTTAWTLDGNFVADFITTGTLSASLIRAGILSSADGSSYWDLDSSEFRFYDKLFDSYVELNEGYINFGHGGNVFGQIIRMTRNGEDVLAIKHDNEKYIILGPDGIVLSYDNNNIQIYEDRVQAFLNNGNYLSFSEGYLWAKVNDSTFRVYDTDDYQFIDANSGGNTYIRVDGKGKYVRVQGNTFNMNGYDAYSGTVTISGKKLTIRNGVITNVT